MQASTAGFFGRFQPLLPSVGSGSETTVPGPRWVLAFAAISLAWFGVGAPAASAQGQSAQLTVEQWAEIAQGPIETPEGPEMLFEPPDGEWLVDDGGEFFVSRWPKMEGGYKWIDEEKGEVKLAHLPVFTAVANDDEYFYFRIGKPPARPVVAGPSQEEIDAVIASYRFDAATVDQLQLVPWEEGLPRGGQWRNGFAIADMNEDGHLDLIHPPPRKSFAQPIIILGDGEGNWRPWADVRFPDLPYDYGDVAVGDLDGDGHQDLVLTIHLTGMVALRGNGKGGFEEWGQGLPLRAAEGRRRNPGPPSTQNYRPDQDPVGPGDPTVDRSPVDAESVAGFSSRAIALADWNGDGWLDIFAFSEGPTSLEAIGKKKVSPRGKLIFLGNEKGEWTPLFGAGIAFGDQIEPVDLDGDGRLDFVTDSSILGGPVILNYRSSEEGQAWESLGLPDPRGRMLVQSVAPADFDGDGHLDLAVSFQARELDGVRRYGVDMYWGEADRAWRRESLLVLEEGRRGFGSMTAGDADGDGDIDLVMLPKEGGVSLLLQTPDGFVVESSPETAPDLDHRYCAGYRAELRDLDADGRNELVAIYAGEPGSEAMFGKDKRPRCSELGWVRVWKIAPQVVGESPSASAAAPADTTRAGLASPQP